MKKQLCTAILLSFVLIVLLFPGCSFFGRVKGAGEIKSQLYNISDFTEIEIGTAVEFEIVPLDIYSISIKANENMFDYLDVSHSGKTLSINLKPISYSQINLVATITLPALNRLSIKGTAHGKVKGFISNPNFTLQASGDSTLDLDVEAGATELFLTDTSIVVGRLLATDLNLDMSAGSRISLSGSAQDMKLKATGDSLANLPDYVLQNAGIILSGTSQANIMLNGILDAELNDSSKLNYTGSPTLGKTDIHGDSKITGP